MDYCKNCPLCGASLDPDERCDCTDDPVNEIPVPCPWVDLWGDDPLMKEDGDDE